MSPNVKSAHPIALIATSPPSLTVQFSTLTAFSYTYTLPLNVFPPKSNTIPVLIDITPDTSFCNSTLSPLFEAFTAHCKLL